MDFVGVFAQADDCGGGFGDGAAEMGGEDGFVCFFLQDGGMGTRGMISIPSKTRDENRDKKGGGGLTTCQIKIRPSPPVLASRPRSSSSRSDSETDGASVHDRLKHARGSCAR